MASRGINKVIIVGNLGQDPEMRFMPSGDAVANLTVATSETWKDKQTGEQKEKTEWHRVVIFGKLAEIVGQYLKKGSKAYFEGRLQTRKWQNQQGQDQYTTEIVIDGFNGQMQMLDSRAQGQQSSSPQQQSGLQQQQQGGGFQQQPSSQQGGFQQQSSSQQQSGTMQGQHGQNAHLYNRGDNQQQNNNQQQTTNQQQGGFQQQQQQQQGGFQQQNASHQKVNPQEPNFDDDIPF